MKGIDRRFGADASLSTARAGLPPARADQAPPALIRTVCNTTAYRSLATFLLTKSCRGCNKPRRPFSQGRDTGRLSRRGKPLGEKVVRQHAGSLPGRG